MYIWKSRRGRAGSEDRDPWQPIVSGHLLSIPKIKAPIPITVLGSGFISSASVHKGLTGIGVGEGVVGGVGVRLGVGVSPEGSPVGVGCNSSGAMVGVGVAVGTTLSVSWGVRIAVGVSLGMMGGVGVT